MSPSSTRTTPSFLTLPGEVRNRIYTHLLTAHLNPIKSVRTTDDFTLNLATRFPNPIDAHKTIPLGAAGHIPQPALAATNRTIRRELLTLMYGGHIFVGPVDGVRKFLDGLSDGEQGMLRNVCLTWPTATARGKVARLGFGRVRGDGKGKGFGIAEGVLRFEFTVKEDGEDGEVEWRTVWVGEEDVREGESLWG